MTRVTRHVDEPVEAEQPTSSGDPNRRLEAVVAELDSLLGALGDADPSDEPVPIRPTPQVQSKPTASARPGRSATDPPLQDDPYAANEAPPASRPADDPATRPAGAKQLLTRRTAFFAVLTLVATAVAYMMGTALGGVTGPAATPDDTSVATPTVQVVTHEFSGEGAAITAWFTAISEFQIASTDTNDGVPRLALETEDGEIQPVAIESGVTAAIGPGRYRIVIDTPGDWSLRVLRVVGN